MYFIRALLQHLISPVPPGRRVLPGVSHQKKRFTNECITSSGPLCTKCQGSFFLIIMVFIGSDQEPIRDFGTERALVEPLGPMYIDFQN